MKKKADFLKVFALLLTLGWMSDVKGQTCDFSYENSTNCDVILTLQYYDTSVNPPVQNQHTDTLFANTNSTFHIPDCENSPNPPFDVIAFADGFFVGFFLTHGGGPESPAGGSCSAIEVDWFDDWQWSVD